MTLTRTLRPFLSPALLTVFVCVGYTAAQAQNDSSTMIAKAIRSIAITATDRVIHQADVATVHIGYELYGPDQPAAYASASQASNAIIAALRSAGVPSDTIESEQQSVAPMEPYQLNQLPASERASRAFVAQQSWTVRTTAEAAARILDIAAKAGANKSGQIDWSLKDPNAASAEAAAKALQRARVQAEAMAAGLNVKLGQLLYASNEVQAEPIRPMAMMARDKTEAVAAQRPLAINARQIETSATVYAVFAIE
ncbi:MAG TPA: SIMPL domain-containing protein [Acidobacteriaceae bacterium]